MSQADVEDLAAALYAILRTRTGDRRGRATVTYGQLCAQLSGRWVGLPPHHSDLFGALGVLSSRCRAAGLPALSALVVGAQTQRPGQGHFGQFHPTASNEVEAVVAWQAELKAAHAAVYPDYANLPEAA